MLSFAMHWVLVLAIFGTWPSGELVPSLVMTRLLLRCQHIVHLLSIFPLYTAYNAPLDSIDKHIIQPHSPLSI